MTTRAVRRSEGLAWAAGALGIAGAAVGWALAPRDFAYAWLACSATL